MLESHYPMIQFLIIIFINNKAEPFKVISSTNVFCLSASNVANLFNDVIVYIFPDKHEELIEKTSC